VAWRLVGVAERDFSTRDEKDLVLAGFIAFLDPPKASAGGAIKALNEHGVRVKIITGDNPIIAAMVCREVGLDPGEIIPGNEIEDMSDDELGLFAEETKVFAKMHRSAASPKGLLSLVGRDVAELLRHAVRKALVYSAVQDVVIAGLESAVLHLIFDSWL
jgi:hypothetical protein